MNRPQDTGGHFSRGEFCIKEIVPQKVLFDSNETLVIMFNKTLPQKGPFMVDFMSTRQARQVPAELLNSYTLKLIAPVYPEANVVTACVYHGIQRSLLGRCKFEFVSKSNMLCKLLHSEVDPVSFMCEALGISQGSIQRLDVALAQTFEANIPHGFSLLQIQKDVPKESGSQYPTLLHFAAAFGLAKLISCLVTCPGAHEACSIKNCHGQRPYNLADEQGFSDLGNSLRSFHDSGDEGVYIDTSGNEGIYTDTSGNDEDLYMPMQKEDGTYVYVQVMKGVHDEYYEQTVKKRPQKIPKSGKSCAQYDPAEETQEDLYQNMSGSTAQQGEGDELYEAMNQGNYEDDSLYQTMVTDTGVSEQYPNYDSPTSNLPVHPNAAFYRSASSAAEVRAKELRERRTKSMPAPTTGALSQQDILRKAFLDIVRAGQLQENEASAMLQRMGITTDQQILPRTSSTSSRTSNSTNSSGYSGSVEPPDLAEVEEPSDHEPIHVSHADLINELRSQSAQKDADDEPPPPPLPDYELRRSSGPPISPLRHDNYRDPPPSIAPKKRTGEPRGGSPGSPHVQGRTRGQHRYHTTAVDGRDIGAVGTPPPPTPPRRPSEPQVMTDPRSRPPAPIPSQRDTQPPKPAPRRQQTTRTRP